MNFSRNLLLGLAVFGTACVVREVRYVERDPQQPAQQQEIAPPPPAPELPAVEVTYEAPPAEEEVPAEAIYVDPPYEEPAPIAIEYAPPPMRYEPPPPMPEVNMYWVGGYWI